MKMISMIKKIFQKILNGLRNLGVLIFGLIGFGFDLKNDSKDKIEDNCESEGGTNKSIYTPLPDDHDSLDVNRRPNIKAIKKEVNDFPEEEIKLIKLNEEVFEALGFKIYNDENLNIIVSEVFENSIADKAGFEVGDIITKVNDESFKNTKTYTFIKAMEKYENEDKKIKVKRKDKEKKIAIPVPIKIKEEKIKDNLPENIYEKKETIDTDNIKKIDYESLTENKEIGKIKHQVNEESNYLNKNVYRENKIEEINNEQRKIENNVSENIEAKEKSSDAKTPNVIENVLVSAVTIKGAEMIINNEKAVPTIDNKSENLDVKTNNQKEEKNTEKLSKEDKKWEDNKDEKKETKEEITEREALMISKITDEDIKEKEEKIEKSYNDKKTLLDLLKTDNRFRIGLIPFMIFKRRMVRNLYKAYLLNNSLVSARRLIGSYDAHFQRLNHMDLIYHIRTTQTFKNMTFDNLYQIDMLKMELQNKYGNELETDPDLIEAMDRINYLESRTIARHQRLIEKERELERRKAKRLILTKESDK